MGVRVGERTGGNREFTARPVPRVLLGLFIRELGFS